MSLFGIHALAVSPDGSWAGVERAVDQLTEAGIRAVEVPLGAPGRNGAARLADFAARNAWTLLPSLTLPPGLDIQEDLDEALDFLEGVLRDCATMGAGTLGGQIAGTGVAADREKGLDSLSRFFERAARLARASGIELRVEPATRWETSLVTCAADAVALVERVGAENLVIGLDSFAMQSEEASFAKAFETAEPFLRFLRLGESHRGLPGTGMMPWKGLFEPLDAMGYKGPAVLHVKPAHGAVRLEELLEEGLPALREEAKSAGFTLG